MPRNAGNDENGRFDGICLTILTNLAKFLFLWKFAHKRRFNGLAKGRDPGKLPNLAKVAILAKFGQGC